MNSQFKALPKTKKIYLASDFHLGIPNAKASLERERKIVRWLSHIEQDAAGIFLLGDVFDFWFEYKHVIPKGFIRFQGKIAELVDKGIPIYFFTGNHDLWMFDYFYRELGIPIIRQPETFHIGSAKFLIGHGDGLGPGDNKFKFFKKVFTSRIAQWAFRWLHPDIGIWLANTWSRKSRLDDEEEDFKGEDEWLLQHCMDVEKKEHHDYYVFGHRHLALQLKVNEHSTYFNLGQWIDQCTYLEVDNHQATLKTFEN